MATQRPIKYLWRETSLKPLLARKSEEHGPRNHMFLKGRDSGLRRGQRRGRRRAVDVRQDNAEVDRREGVGEEGRERSRLVKECAGGGRATGMSHPFGRVILLRRSFRKEGAERQRKRETALRHHVYNTDTWCSARTHQQVLWFDVSVHNVEAVEVFDGAGQIVEHATGVSLRVPVGRGDGVEQISALWTEGRTGGRSVRGTMSPEFLWRFHAE